MVTRTAYDDLRGAVVGNIYRSSSWRDHAVLVTEFNEDAEGPGSNLKMGCIDLTPDSEILPITSFPIQNIYTLNRIESKDLTPYEAQILADYEARQKESPLAQTAQSEAARDSGCGDGDR